MVPELPYDIWSLIAKYLPKRTLWKLYAVNEAFFDIVMDQKYREAFIHHPNDRCTQPCILSIGPIALKRVQALEIRPNSYETPQSEVAKSRQFQRMKINLKENRLLAERQQLLEKQIKQMIHLTSLLIGCFPWHGLEMFNFALPLYSAAWSAHGSRLTSLTLTIPAEAYRTVISSVPPLNALTHLNIAINLAYCTTNYEDILISIAEFVGRHASTLTNLALETPSPIISPLLLFSNIPTLPHLTKVSVGIWYERLRPQYDTKVDQFLERQTTSLTHLTLRFIGPSHFDPAPSPAAFFSSPLFQVHLPRLTTLDMELCRWPEEDNNSVAETLAKYLSRLSKSLTKLTIGRYVFTFNQMKGIVAVFSNKRSQLQSLNVRMHYLSCGLLDLLSSQLPQLQSLVLHFDFLVSRESDDLWNPAAWRAFNNRALSFVQDMAYRKYPNWGLRHLIIRPIHEWTMNWKDCKPLLVAALPGVITFNDESREESADADGYNDTYVNNPL